MMIFEVNDETIEKSFPFIYNGIFFSLKDELVSANILKNGIGLKMNNMVYALKAPQVVKLSTGDVLRLENQDILRIIKVEKPEFNKFDNTNREKNFSYHSGFSANKTANKNKLANKQGSRVDSKENKEDKSNKPPLDDLRRKINEATNNSLKLLKTPVVRRTEITSNSSNIYKIININGN